MIDLSSLHPGYVLSRNEFKERIVVSAPAMNHNCFSCSKVIYAKEKCIRYEKGNSYQFYEHLKCYEENNE